MKYANGQDVMLGDRVRLDDDSGGVVVAVIETGEYGERHPEAQWGYLKKGVMIEFPKYGLIHYEEPEEGLELIERAEP